MIIDDGYISTSIGKVLLKSMDYLLFDSTAESFGVYTMNLFCIVKNNIFTGFLLLALLISGNVKAATYNCYSSGTLVITNSQHHGAVTVGQDMPIGSVLYSSGIYTQETSSSPRIQCPVQRNYSWEYAADHSGYAYGEPFDFAGNPFAGKVYRTNVEGVGLAIFADAATNKTISQGDPSVISHFFSAN